MGVLTTSSDFLWEFINSERTYKAAAGRRTPKMNDPLRNVRVAAPCPADWDKMLGNDRARFCGQCNLNVYNLSSMTRAEAEDFIAKSEGRVCIRYYRRKDGSIITQNCPIGLRALKKRLSYVVTAIVSALMTFITGLGLHYLLRLDPNPRVLPVTIDLEVKEPAVVGQFAHFEQGQKAISIPPIRPTDAPVAVLGRVVVQPKKH